MRADFAVLLHQLEAMLPVNKTDLAGRGSLRPCLVAHTQDGRAQPKRLAYIRRLKNDDFAFTRSRGKAQATGTHHEHSSLSLPRDEQNRTRG